MQKTHDFASSSTALCKQRSPDCKSQEIQEMQCGIRDAANSRCCLHQYVPPQRSTAYLCWPQIGISLEKRSKCNMPREMQRTHDTAISSKPFCNQRSHGSKSQEMQTMQFVSSTALCDSRSPGYKTCCHQQYASPL